MALVETSSCNAFGGISQRDLLARIFSSTEAVQETEEDVADSSSDTEFDDDQGPSPTDSLCRLLANQSSRKTIDQFENKRTWGANALGCEWRWDSELSPSTALRHEAREVLFHPDYSCGTAAAKGELPLGEAREHYWEVKMTSAVYGTDMMIGVGTKDTDLEKYRSSFCSILGRDEESWGLSYFGSFHHKGQTHDYTTKFDRGTTIGIHLDTWNGQLSFIKDDQPLGVAADGLKGKELYPIVSSTAARTKMRLTRSTSVNFSLQYLCCSVIGKTLSHPRQVYALPLPPGIKRCLTKDLDWIFRVTAKPKPKQNGVWDAKRKRKC